MTPDRVVVSGRDEKIVASGAKIDDLLFSSTIEGIDPSTGRIPSDTDEQFSIAFANLDRLIGAAGMSLEDVAQVTIHINDASFRPHINDPWLRTFPTEDKRPSRKTTHAELPPGTAVQLGVIALGGAKRTAVGIEGISHRDPLPMGVRIGDLAFSSVLGGDDPKGGRLEGVAQVGQVFRNMQTLVEKAGGSVDDINQVWVYLGDFAQQPAVIDAWLQMFPEEGNRPSRKTFPYPLGASTLIQLQFTAVMGGKRANFEIPGIGHHDPIPLGSAKGRLFHTSGVDGRDPKDGQLVSGKAAQAKQGLANLRHLMELAGSSLDRAIHITALIGDVADGAIVRTAFSEYFPNADQAPALHVMNLGVKGRDTLVQYHLVAAL